jgi:hypothetical protein
MRQAGPFDALLKQPTPRPSLGERYYRIARLGTILINGEPLSKEVRDYLGSSLRLIAEGADPYLALGLHADQPGQRREGVCRTYVKKKLAIGWIAAASDKSDPASLAVGEAIAAAARHFRYTRGTMKKMWAQSDKSLDFRL